MKNRIAVLIIVILTLLFLPNIVSAAQPPSSQMHVTYNGQDISEPYFDAILLRCQKIPALHPSSPVPQLNISEYDAVKDCQWEQWHKPGECNDSICNFWYAPPEFKLAVYLPNQERIFMSTETKIKGHINTYEANLLLDGSISLQDITPFSQTPLFGKIRLFITALLLILIIELAVAFIFVSDKKIPKKLLISVLIANIITSPILWFKLPVSLYGQIFAFLFEGYFIYLLNKQIITLKRAFILSLILNVASIIIGGAILIISSAFYFAA